MIKSHRSDSPGDRPGVGRCVRSAAGLLGLAAAVLLLAPAPARADITWKLSGTGDWSTASNWSSGVPTASSTADIFNGGTATVTVTGETCNTLSLGGSGGGTLDLYGGGLTVGSTLSVGNSGTATLSMTAGTVVVSGSEYVGNGTSGIGTVTVSGGTTTVGSLLDLGLSSANTGTYTLSAGSLSVAGAEYVGDAGHGTFNQSGGTETITGILDVSHAAGSVGAYTLSAGSLSVTGSEYVGDSGTATFTESGGTNHISSGALYLGYGTAGNGTYSLSAGTLSVTGSEYLGYSGTATFSQTAGSNTVSSNLYLGYNSGSGGNYTLYGGSVSVTGSEYLGYSGTATFTETAGSNTVSSNLYLGYNSGSMGKYNLYGGTVTSSNEYLGYSGTATFSETAGTNTVNSNLYLGYAIAAASGTYTQSGGTTNVKGSLYVGSSGSGTYALSAGSLATTGTQYVGFNGTGNFTQTGGTNNTNILELASNFGSSGSYSLSVGSLGSANGEYVGMSGPATFTQSSGTNNAYNLWLGYNSNGSGTYTLNGGSLSAGLEYVSLSGTATSFFNQSGGTNSVYYLSVGSHGDYSLTGGSLALASSGGMVISGTFNGGGATDTLSINSSILDLSSATVLSASNITLTVGANSLVITSSNGVNPATAFKNYTNAGIQHTAGTVLALTGTQGFAGWGTIADPVTIVNGTIGYNVAYLGAINLNGGLTISGIGTVKLGTGNLITDSLISSLSSGSASSMSGGSLNALVSYVGSGGTGQFTQSGGTDTLSGAPGLFLGALASGSGTYTLSAGFLSTQGEEVGYSGGGSFVQSGGTNTIGAGYFLYLGYNSSGHGTYNLNSGTLSASYEYVGVSGTATFTQTGGINTVSTLLDLGVNVNSSGVYNLNGGFLKAAGISLGSGSGSFNFGGGTLQASGAFSNSLPFVFNAPGGGYIDSNSYTVTLSGPLSGGGGLTKTDSGTLILTGSNTYSGSTTVSGGTLQVLNTAALPGYSTSGYVSVNSGAMLTLMTGGPGEWNSTATTDVGTLLSNATFSASSVLGINTTDATGGATIPGAIAGSLGLTKLGANVLTLTGTSTYSGTTVVSAGTLTVNGGLLSSGSVTVNSGAMLSGAGSVGKVTVSSSGVLFPGLASVGVGTLTAASVTLSNSSILDESLGSTSGQNTMLAVNGSLTLGTSGTLNILPAGPLQSGTYTLATANSISGAGNLSGWTIAGLPAAPVVSISGGTLSLSYTAVPINGVWNSAVGGSWAATPNWLSRWEPNFAEDTATFGATVAGSNALTITLDGNHTLGALGFSTTGGGSYTITTSSGDTTSALTLASTAGLGGTATVTDSGGNQTIAAPINLGSNLAVSVALGNSLTFSGPISGSSTATNLTVSGSGSGVVIFSGTNSYSGSTTVSSGTLRALTPASLPGYNSTSTALVTVQSGAMLAINVGGPGQWNSSGHDDLGDLLFYATTSTGAVIGIDTTNATTAFTYTGNITNTITLDKLGLNTLVLSGRNGYNGGTIITAGILEATYPYSLPGYLNSGPTGVNVAAGAMLAVNVGGDNEWNAGQDDIGYLLSAGTFHSGSTLGIDTTDASSPNFSATISSSISGGQGLTKLGPNTLILTGTNTYSGTTSVSAGTLEAQYTYALSGTGPVTVAQGAVLAVMVGDSGSGYWNSGSNDDIATLLARAKLTFNAGSALGIDTTHASPSFTYSGNISGSEGLTKLGPNTLILNGVNTYSGLTTISGGTLQIGDGSNGSIGGSSDVADSGLLVFNLASGTTTFAGNISGSGSLTQLGGNVLCLAGNNTYTGPTTISIGTLQIGSLTGLASSTPVSISSSGVLDLDSFSATIGSLTGSGMVTNSAGSSTSTLTLAPAAGTTTFSGVITNGAGQTALTLSGAATEVLTGSNTYSGLTTISAGTLQIGSGGTIGSITGTSGVADSGLLVFDLSSGTTTLSGNITGSGGLKQMGASVLCLTGSNTYNGPTTISAGTLQIGDGGAGGSIDGTSGVAITNNSNLLAFDLSSGTTSVLAVISGNGGLTQMGPSLLVLTGSNTYSGLTTIASGGTLQIGSGGTTGSIGGTSSVADNGLLAFDLSNSATFSKSVTGLGGLTQMGSSILRVSGNNTYSGPTTISAGTLQVGGASALPSLAAVSFSSSGAVLDLFGNSPTLGTLTGSGTVTNSGGNTTLTLKPPAGSATFGGVIQNGTGTIALTLSSAGTLVLAGSNTYSGQTTITAGTLQIDSGGTTGSIGNTSSVNDNGQLAFNLSSSTIFTPAVTGNGGLAQLGPSVLVLTGNDGYFGATTIANGGTLQIGSGGTTGAIGNTNGVADNGLLAFYLSSGTTSVSAAISGSGGLTQMGSNLLILSGSDTYTGPTTITSGTLQIGNNGNAGSINGTSGVSDNGLLEFYLSSGTTTLAAAVSGGGGLTQNGFSMLVLTGSNTYNGPTTISQGTLQIGNGGSIGGTSSVTDNGLLAFNLSNSTTFSTAISGSGGLSQLGPSLLVLNGTNTYTGATTIASGGTLQIGDGVSGSISSTGNVTDNGLLAFNLPASTTTFTPTISGSGGLTQMGSTLLIVTGNESYSGPTTIASGTLQVGNGSTGGIGSTNSVTDNGMLAFDLPSGTTIFSVPINGSGGLTQMGSANTLELTGSNTYSGPTTISAGTLQIGNGSSGSISSTANVTDNGLLEFDLSSGTTTLAAAISGSGGLTQMASSLLILTGSNTYTGPTTISAGTLQIGSGGTAGSINNTSGIGGSGTLAYDLSTPTTLSFALTGSIGLRQLGSGVLILAASNTYTGATSIASGATLQIGSGGTAGSINSTQSVADNGLLVFDISSGTFSKNISGSGGLTQMASSVLNLSGVNSYSGPTTISAGTLQMGGGSGLEGSTAVSFGVNSGVLDLNGNPISIASLSSVSGGTVTNNATSSGTQTLTLASTVPTTATFAGVIQNGPTRVVALTLNSASLDEVLAGTDTYTGSTTITAGTLGLGSNTALPGLSPVTFTNASGVLDLGGYSPTIISLTGSGTVTNSSVSSTSTLTLSPTSGTSTFNGVIQSGAGTVGVTVSGTGTMVLAGSNTYTGPTTISSGTLQIGSGGASGSINGTSSVTDNSLLTFDVSGTTTLSAAVSGGGGLSQITSSLLIVTGSNTYTGPTTISNGTLQIGSGGTAGSINNTSGIGGNGTLAYDLSNPTTLSFALTGSIGLRQLGSGVLILAAGNTYTGATNIASGSTLQIGNGGTTGSINSNSSVTDNGLLVFDISSGTTTVGNFISGSGGLTQMGTNNTLRITDGNSYTGPTTISAGTIQTAAATALGNSSTVSINSGAVLDLDNISTTLGSLTGSGTVTNTTASNTATLTLAPTSGSSSTFNGIIQNGTTAFIALTLNGAATASEVLAGVNTYTGLTTVDAGTLQIGDGATGSISGTGNINLANTTAALAFDLNSGTTTVSRNITGSGALAQLGSNLLVLTGTGNTYSGSTTISAGTLQVGSGGTVDAIGSTSGVLDNGLLAFDLATATTFTHSIGGSGGLTQMTGYLLRLTGTNTYNGPTTIASGGTLQTGTATALASSTAVTFGSSTAVLDLDGNSATIGSLSGAGSVTDSVATAATLTLTPTAGSNTTFSGIIQNGAGTLAVNLNGGGTEVFAGANTYTGNTTITAGTLQIGNGSTGSIAGAGAISDGGALAFDLNSGTTTFSRNISGAGGVMQVGSNLVTLSGNNTYTGPITISAGTLQAGSSTALGSSSALTFSGNGVLDLNTYSPTIASLSGNGTVTDNASGSATDILTLSPTSAATATFSGSIKDGGTRHIALTLNDSGGTEVFAGNNSYSGLTTVTAGTLAVTGSLNSAASVTVGGAATLSGTGRVGNVTVSTNGTLAPGFSGGTLTATSLVLSGSSDLSYTLGSPGAAANSLLTITSGLTLNLGETLTVSPTTGWGAGTYVLATYGSLTNDSSNFNGWTVGPPSGLGTYSYSFTTTSSVSSGSLELLVVSPTGISGTWTSTTGGSWGSSGNWTPGVPGNGSGDSALFGSGIGSSAVVVTVDAARTLGGLAFSTTGGGSYTLNPGTAGTLTLVGSGAAATLSDSGGNQLIAAPIILGSNLAVTVTGGSTLTVSAGISESNPPTALSLGGGGELILTGANTYTGQTTISAGTLQIGNGGATGSISSTANITDNGTLVFDLSSGATTLAASVSGTGGLSQTGSSMLTLTGANTYSGPTTITAGTLQMGGASALAGSSAVSISGGALLDLDGNSSTIASLSGSGTVTNTAASGTATLTLAAAAGSTTFAGGIQNGNSPTALTLNGAGTQVLTGANTYSGPTTIGSGATLQIGSGGPTGSIGNTSGVTDNGLLAFDLSTAATFSQSITGNGGLTQMGASLLVLTGSDSYGGATTIASGGTLQVGNGTSGSINGTNTVADSGTLVFDMAAGTTPLAAAISGSGGLTQMGTGSVLVLTGSNTYTGPTTVSAGTLQIGNGTSGSISSTANVTDNGTLAFDLSAAATFTNTVTGSGSLVQAGTNLLVLTGNNTYSGSTTIASGGTLQVGNGASGSIGNTISVADNGTLAFDLSSSANFSAAINGSGGLTQMASTLLRLSGSNTYSGPTTISAGTIQAGSSSALSASSALTINSTSGVLDLGGTSPTIASLSGSGYVTDNASSTTSTLTLAPTSGSTTFTGYIENGFGTVALTLSGAGTEVLTDNNSYSGATTISAGTLRAGNSNALGNSSPTAIAAGAVLDLGGYSLSIGVLTGSGTVTDSSTGAITFTVKSPTAGSATFSGVIQNGAGTVALTVNGSGILDLGGNNTYSGATTISGGTLQAGSTTALGSSSAVSINSSTAVLDLNGNSLGIGSLSSASGGTVTDNAAGSGTDTLTLTPTSTATVTFPGVITNGGTRVVALTLNDPGGAEVLSGANTYSGPTTITAGTLQIGNGSSTGSIGGTSSVTDNGTLTFDLSTAATFSQSISGSGGLTQKASSMLTLSGPNSYSGPTTISAGTLQAGSSTALGNSSAVTIGVSTGVLDLAGFSPAIASLSGSGYVTDTAASTSSTLTVKPASGATATFSGVIQNGSGTVALTLSGAGAEVLAGSNTYTGATTISGGTLQIGSGGASGSINGTSAVSDSGTLAFDLSSGTTTFTKNISGTGALVLAGSSELTLSGSNNYTGGTTIAGGTLEVSSPASLPKSGIINVGRSGVVSLLGLLTIPAADPAGLVPDVSSDAGSVVLAADDSGDSATSDVGASAPADAAGTVGVYAAAAPAGTVSLPAGIVAVPAGVEVLPAGFEAVPEPGTLVLLLVGAAAAVAMAIWRKGRGAVVNTRENT